MKNKIKIIGLGLLLGFGIGATALAFNPASVDVQADCKYGQCNATAKSTGNRCKHCVSQAGDMYCYQHK